MSGWAGYFLKATANNTVLPNEYIRYDSWNSTPNNREEIKAYRDENSRDLTRITAAGRKTALQFQTRDNMHLADKIAFLQFFTNAESDPNQRKISLEYWNDEESTYKTGVFYRANTSFKIKKVTATDIIYESVTIDLVEY